MFLLQESKIIFQPHTQISLHSHRFKKLTRSYVPNFRFSSTREKPTILPFPLSLQVVVRHRTDALSPPQP